MHQQASKPLSDLCPFLGLLPFFEKDARWFCGRDAQTDELLRRLGRSRLLAVVGTSGNGKSSLVRAGLVPSLKRGYMPNSGSRWRVAVMRPGGDPFGALADALGEEDVLGPEEQGFGMLRRSSLGLVEAVRDRLTPEDNLLVVVDQFEEIFRFKQEAEIGSDAHDAADAFVQTLMAAADQDERRIFVVLTMRSDYLGDCAVFRGLPEALNDAQYLIPVMTRAQLREAIEKPVAARDTRIAPELVQRLLNDVGLGLEQELDQLPVLQHALMRTWQVSEKTASLVSDDYERAGEMSRALNQHADELYERLSPERREIAKRVFQRLSEKETAGRDIRRPTSFTELREVTGTSDEELSGVLENFEAFLFASGGAFQEGSTIDITHEALIRKWDKLKGSKAARGWAREEAEASKVYTQLAEAARRDAAPWRDPDLTEALELHKTMWSEPWAERYTHKEDRPEDTRKEGRPKGSLYRRAERFLEKSRRHRFYARVRTWGLVILLAIVAAAAYYIQIQQESHAAESARQDAEIDRMRTEAVVKTAEANRLAAEASEAGANRDQLLADAARLRAAAASLTEKTENYETLSERREAELADLPLLRANVETALRTQADLETKLQDEQARASEITKRLATAEEANEKLTADKEEAEQLQEGLQHSCPN